METELRSLAVVTATVAALLSYCYLVVSGFSPGKARLLALLPVLYLFWLLPFCFSAAQLRGPCAFFLVWLATFKLLLFAVQRGPLSEPNLSLPVFLAIASLPVKPHRWRPEKPATPSSSSFLMTHALISALKISLLTLLVSFYPERHLYPRALVVAAYGVHLYLNIEFLLLFAAVASRLLLGSNLELEAQFAAPYLSSSLQDFWGRRWNIMVARILHPAVYVPVRSRLGRMAGVFAAFLVSGLMHEVMFYYLTLQGPTGEVTCFFLVQGIATAVEVAAKASLRGRGWSVPRTVSAPLVLAFVWVTAQFMFFPPLLRGGVAEEGVVRVWVAVLEAGKASFRNSLALLSSIA